MKTVEILLQEAMDRCENHGAIDIPKGKTLATKLLVNSGRITGDGYISLRYGGLQNTGHIDNSIFIDYFDYPLPVLAAQTPETVFSDTPFEIEIAGTGAVKYVVYWGDGTSSTLTDPGKLQHDYSNEFRVAPTTPLERRIDPNGNSRYVAVATITVVAWNVEGMTTELTRTVAIEPLVHSLHVTLDKTAGTAPMPVVAVIESIAADRYEIDWGDGRRDISRDRREFSHVYNRPGVYTISVAAVTKKAMVHLARIVEAAPMSAAVISLVEPK